MNLKLRSLIIVLLSTMLIPPMAGSLRAQAPDTTGKFGIKIWYEGWQRLGHYTSLYVTKTSGTGDMHGFNLLIGYDTTVLEFIYADQWDMFYEGSPYEWEYFEGHKENPQSCSYGQCPTGLIRLTGIADLDNGDHHPLSLSLADGTILCDLIFHITDDSAFDCSFTPVQFFWADCDDNSLDIDISPTVNLAVSDTVYWWNGSNYEMYGPGDFMPGTHGASDSCLLEKPSAARYVEFYDGGVGIVCTDSINWRGDINRNGIAYEIADFDMYLNYYRIGLTAFDNHIEESVAASDINADGFTLDISDLYYLYGVLIGLFNPFPSIGRPAVDSGALIFTQDISTRTVSFDYPGSLGAVCCVFNGDITPTLLIDTSSFMCSYYYNGDVTVVVIVPPIPGTLVSSISPGPLFTYTGQGTLRRIDTHFRMTSGSTPGGEMIYWASTQMVIGGNRDGTTGITPRSMPRSLARISDHETCAIHLSNFAAHTIYDVDQSSLLINNSIVPLSVSIIPGSPDMLELTVSARDFIGSYACAYDSLGAQHRLSWMPVPPDTSWAYIYTVDGQFTDASTFTSLSNVTITNGAATIPVPSGWPTISDAVAVAFPGDTIMLDGGEYSGDGNRDLDLSGKKIVLTSQFGAGSTFINCGGSETEYHYFAQCVNSPADSTAQITGLTIRDAYSADEGAIYINNAAPIIKGCRFEYNYSAGSGGAINIVNASPDIEFCLFVNNHAVTGGAIAAGGTGAPYLANCTFAANLAESSGGGLFADGAVPSVTNCLFAFGIGGGAIGLAGSSSPPPLSCTDIYGNVGGDWTGGIADQMDQNGNFSVDPLFCHPEVGDYHLDGASPCLPYTGDCQYLTGAYEAGCGILCGDATGDQRINIADAVFLINYIFKGGPAPDNIPACDLNASGDLDIGDVVTLIDFIFRNGPALSCALK